MEEICLVCTFSSNGKTTQRNSREMYTLRHEQVAGFFSVDTLAAANLISKPKARILLDIPKNLAARQFLWLHRCKRESFLW